MRPSELEWFLPMALREHENVMLVGAPGTGKTQICGQMASKSGFDTIFMHPVVAEPTDFKGFPFPYKKEGVAKFLPYAALAQMVQAKKPMAVVIDDIGQSQSSNQAALQQLIEQRSVDGQIISPFVSFLLCTNSRSDKGAGVSHILSTIMGRATIIKLDVDAGDWINWAVVNNMPASLVSYIKLRPTMLFSEFKDTHEMKNYPNPRNVARVGRWQNMQIKPESSEYEVFAGCVGEQFAAEYCAHLKMTRDMPNPEEYVRNPDKPLPEKDDVLYALCTALAYMATPRNSRAIYSLALKMHGEFSLYMVKMMYKKNIELAQAPGALEWFEKNADFLL